MLETSKDLLYIVIAFCILWVTVFICWLLYYFISIIAGVRSVVKSAHEKLEKVDELINLIKDKVEHSATYLGVIVEGVGKIIDFLKERKSKSKDEPVKKSRGRKIKIVEK